jgi:hypothetical protein
VTCESTLVSGNDEAHLVWTISEVPSVVEISPAFHIYIYIDPISFTMLKILMLGTKALPASTVNPESYNDKMRTPSRFEVNLYHLPCFLLPAVFPLGQPSFHSSWFCRRHNTIRLGEVVQVQYTLDGTKHGQIRQATRIEPEKKNLPILSRNCHHHKQSSRRS